MNKNEFVARVMSKIANFSDIKKSFRSQDIEDEMKNDEEAAFHDFLKNKKNEELKLLAKKYNKLTVENAVAYAKEFSRHHHIEIPKDPKTKEVKEKGVKVIYVEVEGEKENGWVPVWWDAEFNGLYGEY